MDIDNGILEENTESMENVNEDDVMEKTSEEVTEEASDQTEEASDQEEEEEEIIEEEEAEATETSVEISVSAFDIPLSSSLNDLGLFGVCALLIVFFVAAGAIIKGE